MAFAETQIAGNGWSSAIRKLFNFSGRQKETEPSYEAPFASEREFLTEQFYHNSEAIQSEYGVMAMMSLYPRQF